MYLVGWGERSEPQHCKTHRPDGERFGGICRWGSIVTPTYELGLGLKYDFSRVIKYSATRTMNIDTGI